MSSSGKFEIAPIGLNYLVNFLLSHGIDADIFNCASEAETKDRLLIYLYNLENLPRFFGVSLHWLAHANGVIT
ncbi:MAG: hypothetical protein JW795_12725, partial [Chitinivibrionales bacterium]|nr:hypothetical protein [Chitinivibrionales bacterium]